MEIKMGNRNLKEPLALLIVGFIIMFIVSLPINDLFFAAKLALSYTFFIFMPFLFLIAKIKEISFLEKFVLTNIAGLGYSSIYVVIDMFLKIKLTNTLFILVTFCIICLSIVLYFKE